jgi:hypothetical protein
LSDRQAFVVSKRHFYASVSIHNRNHPPTDSALADRSRVDCPLLEGRDYREGRSGVAGRQAGISLKGEVSDHEGIFDKLQILAAKI